MTIEEFEENVEELIAKAQAMGLSDKMMIDVLEDAVEGLRDKLDPE